jgi:phage tail-like protein
VTGTSWLLGAGYSWSSGSADDAPTAAVGTVVANDVEGLSLAALSSGAFGLANPDGSLGRLVLPRGVAIDGTTVLVLSSDGSLIYRYDPVRATLVPLPEIGAEGLGEAPPDSAFAEPRRFRHASSIATFEGTLYVADPRAHRVQVFDLKTLALIRIHEEINDPVDAAAGSKGVYIVDTRAGRIHRAHPQSDRLKLVVDLSRPARELADLGWRSRHWDRLAVDTLERLYLAYTHEGVVTLDVFTPREPLPTTFATERIYDSGQIRDRFTQPPPIITDERGALVLPKALADPIGLRQPLAPTTPRWDIGERLYVADLATAALVVYLGNGEVRHRFAPLDGNGNEVGSDSPDAWRIADITASDAGALVLDSRYQILYVHRSGANSLRLWFRGPADFPRQWQRLAVEKSGCLLLWDGSSNIVDRFDNHGVNLGTVLLRDARSCLGRAASMRQPARMLPATRLTRAGAIPRPAVESPSWPKPLYVTGGVWTSGWLDSAIYNCAWDVLELAIGQLPPGSSLQVSTRTSNDYSTFNALAPGADDDPGLWQTAPPLNADPQPDPTKPKSFTRDVLVQSAPGRFLQLTVTLTGNGSSTPVLASVRLSFPRDSLLQYLPAIYSSPPEQHDFLERFLSIMQTTWTAIEQTVNTFERYLDPKSVPTEAMDYLAGWLNITLEKSWTPEQKRLVLTTVPKLRTSWGTVEGLRQWIRVFLSVLGNVPIADLAAAGLPGLVESFVDRRRVLLTGCGPSLEASGGLWSPTVERRFQIGVFDQVGEVALVSTGDPDLDLFQHYAFSFRVYLPATFIRTPEDEALLRRAIELQKPAHAVYELVLVEARLRIGAQSTIDLDTVIGEPYPNPLSCPAVTDAPSRAPYQRLGFDATLAGGAGQGAGALERNLI